MFLTPQPVLKTMNRLPLNTPIPLNLEKYFANADRLSGLLKRN
jgi:hypothetical protein